jgi:hypothetical protein
VGKTANFNRLDVDLAVHVFDGGLRKHVPRGEHGNPFEAGPLVVGERLADQVVLDAGLKHFQFGVTARAVAEST